MAIVQIPPVFGTRPPPFPNFTICAIQLALETFEFNELPRAYHKRFCDKSNYVTFL